MHESVTERRRVRDEDLRVVNRFYKGGSRALLLFSTKSLIFCFSIYLLMPWNFFGVKNSRKILIRIFVMSKSKARIDSTL